jgi:hypothetical protein
MNEIQIGMAILTTVMLILAIFINKQQSQTTMGIT